MTSKPTICFDSGIFISFLRGDLPESPLCRDVVKDAIDGRINVVTSTMAIVETFHLGRAVPPDEAIAKIKSLFDMRWLKVWSITREIAELSAHLSMKYEGQPHDSVFVATAMAAGVPTIYTVDQRFIARYKDNHEGISIIWPRVKNPQEYFGFTG